MGTYAILKSKTDKLWYIYKQGEDGILRRLKEVEGSRTLKQAQNTLHTIITGREN